MKYAISFILGALALCLVAQSQSPMRKDVLRSAAKRAGVVPLSDIKIDTDPGMVEVGGLLFASDLLSFNSDTSCQTCHLDKFSSADGLPNAIGTGGIGDGQERGMGPGDIVPRNTLALWGRGSMGFHTFFWDGKVSKTKGDITSQFGLALPSDDPLVVAVHLPFAELREMVIRDEVVSTQYEQESTDKADLIYKELVRRIRDDADLGPKLANAKKTTVQGLEFVHIAEAIAAFIRNNFQVEETRFDQFMFHDGDLGKDEVAGGLLFYGKGRCASCHSGPLQSDLAFHAMPFDQLGFGKNGFGVDYGRFNATLNPSDTYLFRTPPLVNVTKTAPYTHSGSVADLEIMIRMHVDPLFEYDGAERSPGQRREDIERIVKWGHGQMLPEPLLDKEISQLVEFLKTLETSVAQINP